MSRNGQVGQRLPQRRKPAEHDPYAAPGGPGQWPPQNGGYADAPYNGGHNGGHPGFNGGPQGFPPQQNNGFPFPPGGAEPEAQYGYAPQGQPGYDRFDGPTGPGQAPFPQGGGQQWGAPQDPRGGYEAFQPNGTPGYGAPEPQQPFMHAQDAPPFPPATQPAYETDEDYDDGLADGEDEPRSGRRWLVIVAALVGAIGLGGGMAYTYKMLFTSGSRPPIVKPIDFPNKGKQVASGESNAQVDKKLFTRLGEDSGATQAAEPDAQQEERSTEGQFGGPRPVRIIPISPGGNQGQSAGSQGQQAASGQGQTTGSVGTNRPAANQVVSVPGLMIDMPGQRPGAPQQQQGIQPNIQPRSQQQAQPQQQQFQQPQQQQFQPSQQQSAGAGDPPIVQKKTAMAVPSNNGTGGAATKVAVPKNRESAGTGSVVTPVSSGYVAVLSSQKSRMDAMKAYASMDQKYRDMLSSSTFDVQEADLGDKGIWFRAVVGPPRSFESAKKICDELKTAGYPSCWPARY